MYTRRKSNANQLQIAPSRSELRAAAPGLLLVVLPILVLSEVLFALESDFVQTAYHVPAPIISIMIAAVIAIAVTNVVRLPQRYWDGLQFTTRWLLRIGIVLYGMNFSYNLWLKPGAGSILLIGVATVAIPAFAAMYLGKLVGLSRDPTLLVAVGTGVCGISAIVATQQAIKSDEESAGVSLATILLLGTLVLFAYPVIAHIASLNDIVYGIWTGATTLDLPQLVAAALQGGGVNSLQAALWVKSIRIGLLVPVILVLVWRFARRDVAQNASTGAKIRSALGSFPLFILVFFLVILFNTVYPIPAWVLSPIASGKGEALGLNVASLFLTCAIIGICFRVRRDIVGKTGWKVLLVGGCAWALQSILVLWLSSSLPIPNI